MKTERAIVFREVWRNKLTLQELINLVHEYKNTDIVIDCAKESTLHHDPGITTQIPWDKIAKAKFMNNNTVHLVLGNFSTYSSEFDAGNDLEVNLGSPRGSFVPQMEQAIKHSIIDQVHAWPTYFLVWNGFKIFRWFEKAHVDPHKEKLFFLGIRQAKMHRMLLLDELEKRDLLDRELSAFTCLDPNKVWKENLNKVGGTHYYQGEVKLNPQIVTPEMDIYAHPPNVMKKCLINVVSETSLDSRFWTEKTVWPIVYQMPFLIHGPAHINKRLRSYGFKLFDELIDYSFDNIVSPRERTVAIAKELKRLADLDLNYEEVYESQRPIAEHNLWRLIELYHDDEYMPGFVKNASDRLVRAAHDPDKEDETPLVDPVSGDWLCFTENNGRNQKAVDFFRSNPYLRKLFKDRL